MHVYSTAPFPAAVPRRSRSTAGTMPVTSDGDATWERWGRLLGRPDAPVFGLAVVAPDGGAADSSRPLLFGSSRPGPGRTGPCAPGPPSART